jgi:hypothetical protein
VALGDAPALLQSLDRAKASIDDEIRHEGEAHGKDDAGDDQRNESKHNGDDGKNMGAEKAPERRRIP